MQQPRAFASTGISIDVSEGPIYINGDTCINVGKLVRFLSMLQWGRLVTYKVTTGKVERFTVKCEHCTYGLSGTRIEGGNEWRVGVTKRHGNTDFTPHHEDSCRPFCTNIRDPPHLMTEIPDSMVMELPTEDVYILRRLNVPFNELKVDKQILRRSKVCPTKWNVEAFISYVLKYRGQNRDNNGEDSLLHTLANAATSSLQEETSVLDEESIAILAPPDDFLISSVADTGSTPQVMAGTPVTLESATTADGASPTTETSGGGALRIPVPAINGKDDKEAEPTMESTSSSPTTVSSLEYSLMDPDYCLTPSTNTPTSSSSLKRSFPCDPTPPVQNCGGIVPASVFGATSAANECLQLSYLLPLNTNLGQSLQTHLKQWKAVQSFVASQSQVLCHNFQNTLEELQSYKKIKAAPLPASPTSAKPRKECTVCHLMQEDVLPSPHCSEHQFCIDCMIVNGSCPLCPMDSLCGPPASKKARLGVNSGAVNQDIIMFETYMKIIDSCTSKKTWALMKVASCYEDGVGVERSMPKAVEFYILSADGGNMYAQYRLAQLYEEGEYIMRSTEQAQKWFAAAAAQKHMGAQSVVATDPNLAANLLLSHIITEECTYKCDHIDCEWHLYERCSAIGNDDASRYIGECYLSGGGLADRVDFAMAVKYLERAADQGNKTSQLTGLTWYAKGLMHYYAEGIGRFVEGACECFYEAGRFGHRQGMERYLWCIMPALATQQPIGLSPDKIQSMTDSHLLRIVEHFGGESKSWSEYLQVYFCKESKASPLVPKPDPSMSTFWKESEEERMLRINRMYARNYSLRKSGLNKV